MSDASDEKKIVVDEDWKSQVEAEKKKAAEESQTPHGGAEAMQMPPADFSSLVSTLASQAVAMFQQAMQPEQAEHRDTFMAIAHHTIDLLAVLQEKTKNNLSGEEIVMLNNVLHELRLNFVQVQNMLNEGPATAGGDSPLVMPD